MKNILIKYNKYFSFLLILGFVLCLPVDAWADESIFSKIRNKALNVLVDSRRLGYLLGGFGLIGFAFMAVFNKISWKWFANIAIGLFLVSVMGAFIAYFTEDDRIADDLEYGYDGGTGLGSDGTDNNRDCFTDEHCGEAPSNCPPHKLRCISGACKCTES